MRRSFVPILVSLLFAIPAFAQEGLSREAVRQREDIHALQEKLGQFSNDVRAAQEDASSVKGDVARLKSETESLRKEISRLEGLLQKLDAAREQDRKTIVEEVAKEIASLRRSAPPEAPRAAPTPKPAKPVVEEGYEHIVAKGDFLASIAEAYGVTVSQIKEANNLKSNELKVGQKLFIPKKAASPTKPATNGKKKPKP